MQVAMVLSQNGFASVANIAGGIDAWSVELDPSIARY
jgi:rhodanese-related sulfurtransferase